MLTTLLPPSSERLGSTASTSAATRRGCARASAMSPSSADGAFDGLRDPSPPPASISFLLKDRRGARSPSAHRGGEPAGADLFGAGPHRLEIAQSTPTIPPRASWTSRRSGWTSVARDGARPGAYHLRDSLGATIPPTTHLTAIPALRPHRRLYARSRRSTPAEPGPHRPGRDADHDVFAAITGGEIGGEGSYRNIPGPQWPSAPMAELATPLRPRGWLFHPGSRGGRRRIAQASPRPSGALHPQPAIWLLSVRRWRGRAAAPRRHSLSRFPRARTSCAERSSRESPWHRGDLERDLGVLHRYMVSPAPRTALVLGKAVSSGVRSLLRAVVVYHLALGVRVSLAPTDIRAALMIVLGSALFSTFSLNVSLTKPRPFHGHRPGADHADLLRQPI